MPWPKVEHSALHISSLLVRVPRAEALFVPEDQHLPNEQRRRIESTRGWRNGPIGGPDDFREGYDAMTVVRVTHDTVDMVRPYYHINHDGVARPGFENVNTVSRDHGGLWYELLQGSNVG